MTKNDVPIVRFENIHKSFGSFKAVDGVTLDVPNTRPPAAS